jgi:glutathione S-transferase
VLTLYQAEWCPFSRAVRERLTELGIDFVARQVEPYPEQRAALRELSGQDEIPTLVTEDGHEVAGAKEILRHLADRSGRYESEHRARYREHRSAEHEAEATESLAEHAPL